MPFDVAHSLASAADAGARRGAGRHDPRSRFPDASRAHARGDPARLSGARRATTRGAPMRIIVVVRSSRRGEVERQLGVAARADRDLSGRRAGLDAARGAPADGYVLFFGTLEPRKNVGGLLDAYERLIDQAATRESIAGARAGGHAPPRRRGRGSSASHGRRSPAACATSATSIRRSGGRVYAGARLLVQPSFDEGFGITGARSDDARRPGRRRQPRRAARGARRRRAARRSRRPRTSPHGIAAHAASDAELAPTCAARGVARARAFTWTRTARRVYETYQQAIEQRARRAATGR